MRKISFMILTVISILALTGCGKVLKEGDVHTLASVKTSNGAGFVLYSRNNQRASLEHSARVSLDKGEVATVTFECIICKDKQEFEINTACEKTISCKCPAEIDGKGNKKEYLTIAVDYEQKK